MERLVAVLGFTLVAAGALGLGLWWVKNQREVYAKGDKRALARRRQQLRRFFGWLLVALLLAGAIAIVAGALAR